MDRNNSRFTFIRRQGQGQHQQQTSSMPLNSSSSLPATSNNNHQQYIDNHRNPSLSSAPMMSSYASTMSREPAHDELIRYIKEAWTKVSEQGTTVVNRNESDHQLKNFKPFDLEKYWGQRFVQNTHDLPRHQ